MKSNSFIVINKFGEYGVESTPTTYGVELSWTKGINLATVFKPYVYKQIRTSHTESVVAKLPVKEIRVVGIIGKGL